MLQVFSDFELGLVCCFTVDDRPMLWVVIRVDDGKGDWEPPVESKHFGRLEEAAAIT